ncbi:MAG: ATP-binding protein [Fervidobacterium sp.]
MIGRKICESLIEIFELDKNGENVNLVAEEIAKFIGVNSLSVAIFEEKKSLFRVLFTNFLPVYSKIPYDTISELDHDSLLSLVDSPEYGKLYISKLTSGVPEKMVGLILTKEKPSNIPNFNEIRDFLSFVFNFIPRYEKSKNYIEKYRSLWMLTNLFESSKTTEELIDNFLKVISQILESDLTFFINFNNVPEGKMVADIKKYDLNSDALNVFKVDLDSLDSKTLRYFKGSDKVLYKPSGIEKLTRVEKVLSALMVKSVIGWFVFINKREPKTYTLSKAFDSLDLDIAKDSINRMILAKGRIEFERRLEEEINKLRQLQSSYESLIEDQKEQLRKMNAVHYISQAIRTMYSVKNVYKTLLLGLTSGRLLGYNRALFLAYDEKKDVLIGRMWLGPESENVEEDWKKANQRSMRYSDVVQYLREESMVLELDNKLTKIVDGRMFPYKGHPILERCILRKKIFISNEKIIDAMGMDSADLVGILGTKEFAVIPLIGREQTFGLIIVDNYYTKKPIKETDAEILRILSDSASLAIETAINYEELKNKTLSLERQKSLIEYLREFSDSVLQNMSSAIIVLDREGKITEWNKKAEVYFGRPKEQMTGVELRTLGTEFDDIEEMAFQSMKIKEEITLSNYLIQVMGSERYYDIRITPFWDSEKIMLRGVIITLDDVTDRVNLEKERKKQEKLAALGEMAARVAHELRNPISVLGGFIKRLEKNIDNPEASRKYANIIKEEILRLEQIVNEILDFSREPRSLEFTNFNVNKLINDVYILLEEKVKEKNILFSFETDSEEITINAEYSRMKQVVINLIQNAIEATPIGGKILVETRIGIDRIVISIWNEGTPIDKETSEKLFTPFFTTKVHGTGLGLAICKKIIEDEHNGKIYHIATEDGNKFVVELPKNN